MGIWSRLASVMRRSPRNAAFSEAFWQDLLTSPSAAGVNVDWKTALATPTALRCGLLLADGVSTVPCKLMRKNPATGTRDEAVDHPLYDLLRHKPNDWMTSQQFRETMMLRTVFLGESFAFINRVRGRIAELWPFEVGEVTVEKRQTTLDRSPLYRVNGEEVPASQIFHMRGPSWNGRNGLHMVNLAKEAIGLAVATEQAHAGRFKNGVQTTGVYSVEGTLSLEQFHRLRAFIAEHYAGPDNIGKPLLLDRNAKWTQQGMSGVDAEHLATRQYQDMMIARSFGVLPIMVGIADKTATYASSEQMFLAHSVHTVRPWHRRVGGIIDCFLLSADERRQGYYIHFVDTEMLRGAARDRAEYYARLFSVGALSPNDILGFEDMNGFEGGEHHYIQGAMGRIAEDGSLEKMGSDGGGGDESGQGVPPNARQRMNVGRVLSGRNEELIRGAHGDLGTVLDQLDDQQE